MSTTTRPETNANNTAIDGSRNTAWVVGSINWIKKGESTLANEEARYRRYHASGVITKLDLDDLLSKLKQPDEALAS